jgi:O-antigen/teichoic acid export membrane protein
MGSQIPPFLSKVLFGSAVAFALKFMASVLGFAMFALSSRAMDQHSFGSLALAFNALSFLSVVAIAGQETLIMRSWDEYRVSGRPALARGVLIFSAQTSLAGSLIFSVGTAGVWSLWDRAASAALVLSGCSFLLAHSLLQFTGQLARVTVDLISGEAPREFLWRLIVVIVISGYWWADLEFGAVQFFTICTNAIFIAILFQVWHVSRCIPETVKQARPEYDRATWIARSFRMWISVLLDTTSQYVEVVIVGLILGPGAAAYYFVITRITNVFAMITGGISVYATSQISALFYGSAKSELQKVLRALAVISMIISATAVLVIILGGKMLLWAFGAAYISIYPALIVMAAGAAISTLVGPARHVLLLTGHEGVYARIMAPVLFVRMLLIVVLGPTFGLMGAVIGWTVSTVIMTFALIVASRRLVGLDPSLAFLIRQRGPNMVGLKKNPP